MTDGQTVSARSAQRMKGRKGGPPKGKRGSAASVRASAETTSRDQASRGCSARPMKPAAANGSQTLEPTLPTRIKVAGAAPLGSGGTPSSGPGWNPPRTRSPVRSTAAATVSYILPAATRGHPGFSWKDVYDRAAKSADLLRELERDGWTLGRVRGAHHVLVHPLKPGHVTIAQGPRKGLGKPDPQTGRARAEMTR